MTKHFVGFIAIAVSCVAGSCGPSEDTATAVATATVTLDRSRVEVGGPISATYRFSVPEGAAPIDGQYSVFAHVLDRTGEIAWTDDHQPAPATREWKPGTVAEYTRLMFVPRVAEAGPVTLEIGLYAPASGERLPLAGESSGLRAYNVATFEIAPPSEAPFVQFSDGWHSAEGTADGLTEWQWSKGQAVLTFLNPKRDAELLVQLDQPSSDVVGPQHVALRVGETTVDSFEMPPGALQVRHVSLPAAALGSEDRVELRVSVDKTFVPASVPAMRSSDTRELGIRVFRAFLQPK